MAGLVESSRKRLIDALDRSDLEAVYPAVLDFARLAMPEQLSEFLFIPAVSIAGGLSALPGVLVEREVAVAGRWRVFLLRQCATASASAVVIWIGSRYFRWPLTQLPTDPPDELFAERPGVRADHVAPVETGPQRMIDCAPDALDETGRHDTRVVQEALLHE